MLIAGRTILAMITLVFLVLCITADGYHAASIILTALLGVQLYTLIQFVSRTNAELTRFFSAARYADFSQRFDLSKLGAGFDELGDAFGDILSQLQKARNEQEQGLRHVRAVVEHVPVPLLSVNENQQITLWNNSARRLFGTHAVININDLAQFNSDFPARLLSLKPGERSLLTIAIDGQQQQLSIAATQVTVDGKIEQLISLQDIHSELASAQLDAWQDLVRVLTHEIMNSITPVASLAKTTVDLVDDIKPKVSSQCQDDLNDISEAVQTVARRSDGLMQFVSSYRKLTRLPAPNKQTICVKDLLANMALLAEQNWQDSNIALEISVLPDTLTLFADREMIEQVLLNLLQNAQHAVNKVQSATITVSAFINIRGNVVIEVQDNGTGIPDDIADKIFIPFFTTKRDGSGVGLALTRQIMLAHQGHINVKTEKNQGSCFSLTF